MPRTVGWLCAGAVVLLAAVGCNSGPDQSAAQESSQPWHTLEADRFLSSLEDALVAGGVADLEFTVVAEGQFEAEFDGTLRSREGGAVQLNAAGRFGGEPVTLTLSARDGRMTGGRGDAAFDEPVPPELHEALVIGLVRMGILHNLARLVGGAPPDHAGGGVRDWVEAREIDWVTERPEAGERGVAFEIWVADQPAGEATLWLGEDGRLVGRSQVVRFPGGEMVVRERYRF